MKHRCKCQAEKSVKQVVMEGWEVKGWWSQILIGARITEAHRKLVKLACKAREREDLCRWNARMKVSQWARWKNQAFNQRKCFCFSSFLFFLHLFLAVNIEQRRRLLLRDLVMHYAIKKKNTGRWSLSYLWGWGWGTQSHKIIISHKFISGY